MAPIKRRAIFNGGFDVPAAIYRVDRWGLIDKDEVFVIGLYTGPIPVPPGLGKDLSIIERSVTVQFNRKLKAKELKELSEVITNFYLKKKNKNVRPTKKKRRKSNKS